MKAGTTRAHHGHIKTQLALPCDAIKKGRHTKKDKFAKKPMNVYLELESGDGGSLGPDPP